MPTNVPLLTAVEHDAFEETYRNIVKQNKLFNKATKEILQIIKASLDAPEYVTPSLSAARKAT